MQRALQDRAEHFSSQEGSGRARSEVQSLFSQLGMQLNWGHLSSAQQTYNRWLNTLRQSGFNELEGSNSSGRLTHSLSVCPVLQKSKKGSMDRLVGTRT